ncbi:MAG: hypothetical protein AAFV53_35845 [Myxococcota bacterium]
MTDADAADLGRAFRRVRYDFHASFFDALSQRHPAAAPLAGAFADIWTRCRQWATEADLNDHSPTPMGRTPDGLADEMQGWSENTQAAMLAAVKAVIAAEADGDHRRGRTQLSARLRRTLPLLDDLIDSV